MLGGQLVQPGGDGAQAEGDEVKLPVQVRYLRPEIADPVLRRLRGAKITGACASPTSGSFPGGRLPAGGGPGEDATGREL
ncbi:hypothetical protein [Geodermatophilus obscurus]|uniref:hypothetical protein n=1 Tax=Geodermatophilus obscurus TaxID=1861 RepID=UPI0003132969|nr:hypothetical protein [Geodermatophilus obscurus]